MDGTGSIQHIDVSKLNRYRRFLCGKHFVNSDRERYFIKKKLFQV